MTSRQTQSRARPSKKSPKFGRTCLLVLGMHRSGTSALTRMISLLGADLPRTLLNGTPANIASNAKGHWESEPLVRLNDEIFDSAGINWRSPEVVPNSWYESVRFEQFRNRALGVLENEFGQSPLFVCKDPRLCKLVPFWVSVLEKAAVEAAIVTMVRNPGEVAESLLKRNGLDLPLGLLMWLRYVLGWERDSRGKTRVHLSYSRLLEDWEASAQSIARKFGIAWPSASADRARKIDEFLSSSDRHYRRQTDPHLHDDVSSWAMETYSIFERWVEIGESEADYAHLDGISENLDKALQPLLAPVVLSYEKSAAVQKLQVLRSKQNSEIEDLQSELRGLHEELSAIAADITLSSAAIEAAQVENDSEWSEGSVARLAAAIKAQREATARELQDVEESRDRLQQSESALREELSSRDRQLQLKELEKDHASEAHARALADLSTELEQSKKDHASREQTLHELLNLEREQRAATEAKLSRLERLNTTLLIIRGRFEAASEELARLAAARDSASERSEGLRKEVEAIRQQLEETQKRSKTDRDKLRDERDKLQAAVAALRDDRAARLAERDNRIKELKFSIKRLEREAEKLRQARASKRAQTESSSRPKAARSGQSWLRRLMPVSDRRQMQRAIELVERSGLFDAAYYLQRYDDLEGDHSELLKHFLLRGGAEGRAPSAAFDSGKYLERYSDVAAAGLNPLVHFLENGRAEGRASFPVVGPDAPAESSDRTEPSTMGREAAELNTGDESRAVDPHCQNVAEGQVSAISESAPCDWFAGRFAAESFSGLADGGVDWLRSAELPEAGAICVGDVRVAVGAGSTPAHSTAALSWFDTLTGRARPAAADDPRNAVRSGLCDGHLIVEDAWLSTDFTLRLRISGSWKKPLVIRCCQQMDEGRVSLRSEKLLVVGRSYVVDLRLASRFAPIAVVITDPSGLLIDTMLLPFPTLVRGGLHHAELIDYSRDPAGWAAHESYASALLAASFNNSNAFAVREVSVDLADANGTEAIFSRALRQWLSRQFKVKILPRDLSGGDPQLILLSEELRASVGGADGSRKIGRSLLIDATSIPTLWILLAADTELEELRAVRTLVVDELTRRPLHAIDHPIFERGGIFQQAFDPPVTNGPTPSDRTATLAIRSSANVRDIRVAFPVAGDAAIPGASVSAYDPPVSAIILCSADVEALIKLLASLGSQRSVSSLECLLVGSVPEISDSALLPTNPACPITLVRTELRGEPVRLSLRTAAELATHDHLLIVDDRKVFHDPRTLGLLVSLCMREETGTASCQLVVERINKNSVAEYSVRSGIVPLRSDRRTDPHIQSRAGGTEHLSFYPVLANPIGALMSKRKVWAGLKEVFNDDALDTQRTSIDVGRAIIESGKLNLTTSLVSICDMSEDRPEPIPVPWLSMMPQRFISFEEY